MMRVHCVRAASSRRYALSVRNTSSSPIAVPCSDNVLERPNDSRRSSDAGSASETKIDQALTSRMHGHTDLSTEQKRHLLSRASSLLNELPPV
eukprot:7154779-Prymnesium_polylepis.2